MERWVGRVAVVTGASSGIGAAIVLDLCRAGIVTVGLARRVEQVQQLAEQLSTAQRKLLHARRCDVAKEADIVAAFAWVERQLGGCDILVNNAGILRPGSLLSAGNSGDVADVLAVNVTGVVLATREAFRSMRTRIKPGGNGHVVLINSVAGHNVAFMAGMESGGFNVYHSSKHAVTALVEVLRQEFQQQAAQIKVTVCASVSFSLLAPYYCVMLAFQSISPGAVQTEIIPPQLAESLQDCMLKSEDISAAVMYVLGTPPNVQVSRYSESTEYLVRDSLTLGYFT